MAARARVRPASRYQDNDAGFLTQALTMAGSGTAPDREVASCGDLE